VNRALRAATMGVLLLSPIVLTACSAGQVTQTASQERDKTGGQAQVGPITVRAAELESPRGGVYEAGDDADLTMAIVNGGQDDDTLTGVDGEGFGDAEIDADGEDEIVIPADESVFVGPDGDAEITLTDLDEGLTVGQYLELTLTFENAGEVDIRVTVANPDEAEREEAYDFHHEEGETSGETAREEESGESE
jgi:copper(I)-binding protein